MTDLEAAIGVTQLKKLPSFVRARRAIAARYRKAFSSSAVVIPSEDQYRNHVYYRYVVRIPNRSRDWLKQMRNQGIDVKEPIFRPLHRYLNLPDSQFPHSTQAFEECCSIPIFPSLNDEDCNQVCRAIREESLQRVEI